MKNSKELRNKIYKKALKLHLDNIKYSKIKNLSLLGMCCNLNESISLLSSDSIKIVDLEEFLLLKPKNKSIKRFWWSTKNTSTIRIEKYKRIIEATK